MSDKTAAQLTARATNEIDIAASQLSALVDDELDGMEIGLMLRRLCRDDDLQSCWSRYHLISDVVQGHLPDVLDSGFSARIRQVIVDESPPRQVGKPLPAWYKPVTGFGLAASVVLVALFGLKLTQVDEIDDVTPVSTTQQVADDSSGSSLASRQTAGFSPTPRVAQAAGSPFAPRAAQTVATFHQQADRASEPVDARLNSYLVNHNGYASLNSMHGMLPYVRMVGYQQTGR